MQRESAVAVVDQLNAWGVSAALIPNGQFHAGVGVRLPDGTEARWGTDRTHSVRGYLVRDGVLVGYARPVDREHLSDATLIAWSIATAEYSDGAEELPDTGVGGDEMMCATPTPHRMTAPRGRRMQAKEILRRLVG